MNRENFFKVVAGVQISSASSVYEVQALLGSGAYGEVAQCIKRDTGETVALKIIKRGHCIANAKKEMVTLQKLKDLGSDNFHIVRWNHSFTFRRRFCLDFEKLDITLWAYLLKSPLKSLGLAKIRPIFQQLATALEFLKRAGIVHADLKPENIMMIDHVRQPLRIKVIDFGLACDNPAQQTGVEIQTMLYRSPEVLLGAPFNQAIDVWSLGCIAAELLMGIPLFPGYDGYDMMKLIYYTIGKPSDHILNSAMYTYAFFCPSFTEQGHQWRFMSEFEAYKFPVTAPINNLSDLIEYKVSQDLLGEDSRADKCDRASFVDLLTKTLKIDAAERITPNEILQHSFITMSHLSQFSNSSYVKSSKVLMKNCLDVSYCDGKAVDQETEKIPDSPDSPDEGNDAGWGDSAQSEENSPTKKRKRNSDCQETSSRFKRYFNSSPDTPALKRTKKCLDSLLTETSERASPAEVMLLKRKRDEADECVTSDCISPTKKPRGDNLSQELTGSVNKLFSSTEVACSTLTLVNHPMERERDDDDSSGFDEERTSQVKLRRASLKKNLQTDKTNVVLQ